MKRAVWVNIAAVLVVIFTLLPAFTASAASPPTVFQTGAADFYKVLAPPGILDPTQPGITMWYDYGAFALYRVTPDVYNALPVATQAQVTLLDQADQLLLNSYPFDTQRNDLTSLPLLLGSQDVSGPALHLLQFVGPVKDEWLAQVTAAGAEIVQYIPNYSYLVWADDAARAKLTAMAQAGDIVQFSAPYQPDFKLGTPLHQRLAAAGDEMVDVVVQIYNQPDAAATKELVQKLFHDDQTMWSDVLAYQNAYGTARVSDLAAIAARPDVVWVGERVTPVMLDEVQNQIIAGNLDGAGPSGPGYLTWLADYGFSTDPADYPIVDIVDDGIGNGTVNSGDSTLHYLGNAANATRLAYVSNCTTDLLGDGAGGHGHINSSIVGGYDNRTGFPFQDPDGYLRGVGVSPYGRLAGTKIFANSGYLVASACGDTYSGIIKHSQDLGAQITSNSWGAPVAGDYDDGSQAYDVGVRDADTTQPGSQPMIIFFSAGNSGASGVSTTSSPGTAKNVITVGASENDRPSDEDGDWTDGCAIDASGADNAMDITYFSSRGPAEGGRVKPEIVAPGSHIQGTANNSVPFGGTSVCDQYHPSNQTEFAASSGTSHSTPALAGVGSLYYYWLENEYGLTPSPAMMKAYIIAHPTYLTGVDANDTLPSNNQGYGMPNMGLAFDGAGRYLLDQSHRFTSTGQIWQHESTIADPSKPVRVVLAFTDAPGSLSGDPQVNDLNLQVTVGGQTYRGNVFSGQWSATGGSADANNNYEAVFLPAGAGGTMQITVTAANIAGDGVPYNGDTTDQDFALVVYNTSASSSGWLAGQITTAGTGAPIEGAIVTASRDTSAFQFSTDSAGAYSRVLQAGTYTVTVSALGYVPQTFSNITISAALTTPRNAALSETPSRVVSGDVRDATNGWPLYATIIVDGYTSQPFFTDPATGAYSMNLSDNAVHTATITSLLPGYLTKTSAITLSGSDATRDFALAVDTEACTAPGYTGAAGLDEGFETAVFPPEGWAAYILQGNDFFGWWQSNEPHSGLASAYHVNYTDYYDSWLRLPAVPLGASPELRFWENEYGADAYQEHSLYICTTNCSTPPTNYAQVDEYDSPVNISWVERVTDLSAYAGQTVYLAFRYQGDSDLWYIDDVSIPAECHAPAGGGLVVGKVSTLGSGDPLNGVTVSNSAGYSATTTSLAGPAGAGFYTLFGPPGTTTLTATLTGYRDTARAVTIPTGNTVRQDIVMLSSAAPVPVYVITPTVGAGGSISPAMPQAVNYDEALTFTITPDTGYHGSDVLVDGGSVGPVSAYTFTNVITHHTISATFALNVLTLTVNTVGNGSVSRVPSQTTYLYGDVVTLTAAPDPGWYFGQWSGAESSALTQTTVAMDADKAITATFTNQSPTANAGDNLTTTLGKLVTLDGSGSSDPDGTPLTFGWTQIGGPAVTFTPTLSVTTFTAPDSTNSLTFTLTITDTGGLNDTDEVVVNVYPGQTAMLVTPSHPVTFTASASVTINIPIGAISQAVTLVYSATTVPHSAPTGFSFAGTSFAISVYQEQTMLPGLTFAIPVTLTVQYSDEDVADENESSLTVYYWDEDLAEWSSAGIEVVTRDTSHNRLVARLYHLSEFGLFTQDSIIYYFPLIYKGFSYQPDLDISDLSVVGQSITVTLRNQGRTAVTDNFWVDVYFNPTETPGLNHKWESFAEADAVWGVTANIGAGDSLTLTSGGAYYRADLSSSNFPDGAKVYGYVDSVNYGTDYGNVWESNEANNLWPDSGSAGVQAASGGGVTTSGLPGR